MSTTNSFEGGLYYDRASADDAIARLQALGYTPEEISVMMKDQDRAKDFAEATGTKAAEGTVTGGVIGGALGAIIAGLTATGSIAAIAGTGGLAAPLVVGPLAAALAGLGAGAITGGVIGALVGAGIPEDRARTYQEGLDRGGMLLGVNAKDDNRDRVRDLFAPTYATTATRGTIESNDTTTATGYDPEIAPRRNV